MEIDDQPDIDEPLLKKREIRRDSEGRFERYGTGLIKKQVKKKAPILNAKGHGGLTGRGPGRPKGSQNKTTLALKEMILASLDQVGGVNYLAKLAIENSSAYASLVAKVLPSTLQASESDGGPTVVQFVRTIVMPDGHKYVEGVTPKQIAPPASHTLPSEDPIEPSTVEPPTGSDT
jgi:hypothetical protein